VKSGGNFLLFLLYINWQTYFISCSLITHSNLSLTNFRNVPSTIGEGGGPSSQAVGHFFFVEGDYCISFIWELYPSSPLVFSGVRVTRSLVLCVCFVDRCLSFYTFLFGHCVVCSSSIYGFWLHLWYLQTLLIQLKLEKRKI
jgi:hypothetical protein